MTSTPQDLIRELGLAPHPEGGQLSKLHRIDADEGWHLYLGGPLLIHELDDRLPDAPATTTGLGPDVARGERPQHVVPAGRWFGAELAPGVAALIDRLT